MSEAAPVRDDSEGQLPGRRLDPETDTLADRARRAYGWILKNAIVSPYYDIAFDSGDPRGFVFPNGDTLRIPRDSSYTSYVLLPLITLFTKKKALLVGGPGRGKTGIAMLLGLIAGYSHSEVRRSVQHGHPQLTVSDLLGCPLPCDLMQARAQGGVFNHQKLI